MVASICTPLPWVQLPWSPSACARPNAGTTLVAALRTHTPNVLAPLVAAHCMPAASVGAPLVVALSSEHVHECRLHTLSAGETRLTSVHIRR